MIAFSGFGSSYYTAEYLEEGEWATGTITMRDEMQFGAAFILPHDGILQNIYVMFSTGSGTMFAEDSTIRPFVCLAVSNSDALIYTILQDTLTYTEPFEGGVEFPRHTNRRGSLTNLNIPITEGTLVAIVAGIMAENADEPQYGMFSVSGGLYLE